MIETALGGVAGRLVGAESELAAAEARVGLRLGLVDCSFVAGTRVLTPSGLVPVEEIEGADIVASATAGGPRVPRGRCRRGRAATGRPVLAGPGGAWEVVTTAVHPFWVEDEGWVEVGSLALGDTLVGPGGEPQVVLAVEPTGRWEVVYNFTVEGDPNYFVGAEGMGGALVHNCPVPRRAGGGADPVATGQAGEAAVRAVFDIGPKVTIDVGGRARIPDGLNSEALSEVNNVGT